ncbi:hypothetical protein MMC10_010002 [Thelotrema lepadinum]|nr:hypothetical protein [Thelotrema lepadinum]
MSNQKTTTSTSQLSHDTKQAAGPAGNDGKQQDKAQDNMSPTTMPADLKYFIEYAERVCSTALSHGNIATYPEEIRPKLTEAGEKVRENIAAQRQVYADLAKEPSNQSIQRRRVLLFQELKSFIPKMYEAAKLFEKEAIKEGRLPPGGLKPGWEPPFQR